MEIVKYPAPILLAKTKDITDFAMRVGEATLTDIVDFMRESMLTFHGQGLAANQIDFGLSIALVSVSGWPEIVMFNPVITWSKGEDRHEEGCLSMPGKHFFVKRAMKIRAEYQDISGAQKAIKVQSMLGFCIQHEIDHLNGINIVERAELPCISEEKE